MYKTSSGLVGRGECHAQGSKIIKLGKPQTSSVHSVEMTINAQGAKTIRHGKPQTSSANSAEIIVSALGAKWQSLIDQIKHI